MEYVTRINLKTSTNYRKELIEYCLLSKQQNLAIGWSCVYKNSDFSNFEDYYYAVKEYAHNNSKRLNHVLNILWYTNKDDLFWTRDLDGNYWICKATDKAIPKCNEKLDIGAVIPVKAYNVGMQVPGIIKASFNRHRGGTAEKISDSSIVEYSKYIYNKLSKTDCYSYNKNNGTLFDNLPDFDLEELIISYLQIKNNYYVLSNSIANKSTTIKVECELISRDKNNPQKAVVQVKGGKSTSINALDYKSYVENGYFVYLFAPHIENLDKSNYFVQITKDELISFYNEYKAILPKSITEWENLFD